MKKLSKEKEKMEMLIGASKEMAARAKPDYDPVNKPKHYAQGNIQPLDAIEDWKLNFNLGQVIKYVARAGKKEGSTYEQDIKKAEFYLRREILLVENSKKQKTY